MSLSKFDNEYLNNHPTIKEALQVGYDYGFAFFKNFVDVDHTALDVAESYYFGKSKNLLSKENEANYNNRWLQFRGPFTGKTEQVYKKVRAITGASTAHVYANWIANGNQYGRHNDSMDVIIVQLWNQVAYCCESPYGGKAHHSFVLDPGDAIYIRAGTFHTPVIFGERMSLSFSWSG